MTKALLEILQKAGIGLDTLDQSQVCITDVIQEKNEQVTLLQRKLKAIKDAHASMIDRHKQSMEESRCNTDAKVKPYYKLLHDYQSQCFLCVTSC